MSATKSSKRQAAAPVEVEAPEHKAASLATKRQVSALETKVAELSYLLRLLCEHSGIDADRLTTAAYKEAKKSAPKRPKTDAQRLWPYRVGLVWGQMKEEAAAAGEGQPAYKDALTEASRRKEASPAEYPFDGTVEIADLPPLEGDGSDAAASDAAATPASTKSAKSAKSTKAVAPAAPKASATKKAKTPVAPAAEEAEADAAPVVAKPKKAKAAKPSV